MACTAKSADVVAGNPGAVPWPVGAEGAVQRHTSHGVVRVRGVWMSGVRRWEVRPQCGFGAFIEARAACWKAGRTGP